MNDKEIKVDKDIPIPPSRGGPGILNLKGMKVGDSFFIADNGQRALQANAGNRARSWCAFKGMKWKFTTRKVEGGVRVWRIE